MRTNYVITIARNFGAGGKSVGLALSKELGIPCYERQNSDDGFRKKAASMKCCLSIWMNV